MKYPIFTIRDHKVGYSPQLQLYDNTQAAMRGFAFLVSNDKQIMGFTPFDYDLYQIGIFDVDSGHIETQDPEFVVNGGNAFEKYESEDS